MAIPHKKLDTKVTHKVVIRTPQTCTEVQDGGGRKRYECETETVKKSTIVRTPKIKTHKQNVKGSQGKPMNNNGKAYPKKEMKNNPDHAKLRDSNVTDENLDKCGTGHGGDGKKDDKKKKKMVSTPKKK